MGLFDKLRETGKGETVKVSDKVMFKLSSYPNNPIVKPEDLGLIWREDNKMFRGAVFNGGAEIYRDHIILSPRCHNKYIRKSYFDEEKGITRYYMENYISKVCFLESEDGISFRKSGIVIEGVESDFKYGIEDIRIVKFENDEYILVGCGKKIPPFKGSGGDRIAIYTTYDFRDIVYRGIVDAFDSRNSLLFPEFIDNKLYMIFRFHPNIHIDVLSEGLEQIYNPEKYYEEWKEIYQRREDNLLIKAGKYVHEAEKVGGGPPPIKTKEGWLLIYHAVGHIDNVITSIYGLKTSIKRGYSISAALLDINDPTKVLFRTKYPVYIPHKPWEYEGNREYPVDIPYVVFPTGSLIINDRLVIYAGSGDKYMILLSAKLENLLDYIIKYGERSGI
jgi:predicted GH43/DUF377 family glycosyl hydrolase